MNKSIIRKIDNLGWIFGSATDFADSLERLWDDFIGLPEGRYAFWLDNENRINIIRDSRELAQPTWRCEYWHNFVIENGILCTVFGAGTHSVYVEVCLQSADLLYVVPDQIPSERCWGNRDYSQRVEYIYRLWNRRDGGK